MKETEKRLVEKLNFLAKHYKEINELTRIKWFPNTNEIVRFLANRARVDIGYAKSTAAIDIVHHLEDVFLKYPAEVKTLKRLQKKIDFVKQFRIQFAVFSWETRIDIDSHIVNTLTKAAIKKGIYQDYSKPIDVILALIEVYREHVKPLTFRPYQMVGRDLRFCSPKIKIEFIKSQKENKMIKIIKSTDEMTIDRVQEIYDKGKLNEYFIFYYSQNQDYPVFLKIVPAGFAFEAPLFNRQEAYKGATINRALELAQRARTVYIVHRNDYSEIFKDCPHV